MMKRLWCLILPVLVTAITALSGGDALGYRHDRPGVDEPVVLARTDTGRMGAMSAMMRPDMAAPAGVPAGMSPKRGAVMLSLQAMGMRMDGNRDGVDDVSTQEVLSRFPVAPLDMDMVMLMAGAMYGVTDDLSVMAMVPYLWMEMDHVTRTGVSFTTKSEGIGDIGLLVGYDLYQARGHAIKITAGLSLPTGSTDETDDTPAGADQLLPYPMQTGSGTFDLLPAITYTGRSDDWSWGAQFTATLRLGENREDYRLGNIYQASAWGARKWTGWLSSSLRVIGESEENIHGADPRLDALLAPTADPDLRGGDRIGLGLGLNFLIPSGPLQGVGLSVEAILPLYRDLDGPQLERDYTLVAGFRKAFSF